MEEERFWRETCGESNSLEYADLDGRIILRWILSMWDWLGGMDWIDLAQDSEGGVLL
jgi:hypothetical protein